MGSAPLELEKDEVCTITPSHTRGGRVVQRLTPGLGKRA